ncbi:DUF3617 domain-containing protein [Craterilacuibacter sp.]|uniref:DUF3617 domain-containing protein n=1 Tax=Craterilacuibacter sp. TaxID=2870909 RepID=UPI003F38698A
MRRLGPVCLLALASPVFAASVMQPGLWEISTRIQIPGVKIGIPPVLTRQCFTATQLKENGHPLPLANGCRIKDHQHSGVTTRWNMQCQLEHGIVDARGEIRYGSASYQGSARFSDNTGGQLHTIVHQYTGKRLGACN